MAHCSFTFSAVGATGGAQLLRWALAATVLLFVARAPAAAQADDAAPGQPGRCPRLVLVGEVHDPEEALAQADRIRQLPFEGYFFAGYDNRNLPSGDLAINRSVFGPRRLKQEDYTRFISRMRDFQAAVPSATENFLCITTLPGTLDNRPDNNSYLKPTDSLTMWLSNDFEIVLHNARVAASVAREAGMRGIMFDVETYGGYLWWQDRLKDAAGKTTEEVRQQIRKRGAQFMQEITAGYPDMEVLFLFFAYDIATPHAYPLLAPFLDGLFEAAPQRLRVVAGCENYQRRSLADFLEAYWFVHAGAKLRCGVPAQYGRAISAGFSVWMQGEKPAEHLPPDRWRSVVTNALSVADDYVWVYSEGAKYPGCKTWLSGDSDEHVRVTRQLLNRVPSAVRSDVNRSFHIREETDSRRRSDSAPGDRTRRGPPP